LDPWSLTWAGVPDETLLSELGPGVYQLLGAPFVYVDEDGDGAPGGRERPSRYITTPDGYGVSVSWITAPADMDFAYRLVVRLGVTRFGWAGVVTGEGGYEMLDDATTSSLLIVSG
jgi:hypothetical protein